MSREPAPSTACCDARALLRVLAEASSATDCVRLTFHTSLNHSLVTPLAFRSIHRIHVHNTGSLRGRGALTFSRLYPSTRINSPPFSGCFVHILNMYRVRPGSTSKASVSTQGLFGAGPYSATNPSSPSQSQTQIRQQFDQEKHDALPTTPAVDEEPKEPPASAPPPALIAVRFRCKSPAPRSILLHTCEYRNSREDLSWIERPNKQTVQWIRTCVSSEARFGADWISTTPSLKTRLCILSPRKQIKSSASVYFSNKSSASVFLNSVMSVAAHAVHDKTGKITGVDDSSLLKPIECLTCKLDMQGNVQFELLEAVRA
eukprot:746495-Rhodomonas_salina.1